MCASGAHRSGPGAGPAARRVALLARIAGVLFGAAGAAAWAAVSKQLDDERITVPGNAPILAGRRVRGPVSAYVQALVIKGNAERGAGGRSFADISAALAEVEKGSDEERALRSQSAALATAASLRTSLLTSVLAFGVSALVAGIGALLVAAGTLLRGPGRRG